MATIISIVTVLIPYMLYLAIISLILGIVLKCAKNQYAVYAFVASGIFAILFALSIITIMVFTVVAFGKLSIGFLQFLTNIPY